MIDRMRVQTLIKIIELVESTKILSEVHLNHIEIDIKIQNHIKTCLTNQSTLISKTIDWIRQNRQLLDCQKIKRA